MADQAAGPDGLMYFVDRTYPTTTTGGGNIAALRKGFLGGTVARFGDFPYSDEGLAATRAAYEADRAARIAEKMGGGTGGNSAKLIDLYYLKFFFRTATSSWAAYRALVRRTSSHVFSRW